MVDKEDDKKKSKHSDFEEDHDEFEDYDFSEDIDEDFGESGDYYKKQENGASDGFQEIGVRDKAVSFFKENIVYLLIILLLIVPGILMFKNKFFKSEKPTVKVEQTSTEANSNIQFSSSTSTQTPTSQTTPTNIAVQHEEATQVLPVEEYEVTQPQFQSSSVPTTYGAQSFDTAAEIKEELATIDEHLSKLDERFTRLEQSLQSLSSLKSIPIIAAQIEALETNQKENAVATKQEVERISNNINRLGTVVNQLSRTIYQRNLTETASERVSTEGAAVQSSDFVVHAVIPGRAWLRNPEGALVSVQVGDEIPGYGKVVAINSQNGTVRMSSNHIFKEDTNH